MISAAAAMSDIFPLPMHAHDIAGIARRAFIDKADGMNADLLMISLARETEREAQY